MLKKIISLAGMLYLSITLNPVLAGTGHSSQRSLPTETTLNITSPRHSSIVAKSVVIAMCDDNRVLFIPETLASEKADIACSKYEDDLKQIIASSGYTDIKQIVDRLNQLELAAALSIAGVVARSKK